MSLAAVILSQTRRILSNVLRLSTDYTTARAVEIDTINSNLDVHPISSRLDTTVSSRMSQATSPSGNIETDVENGIVAEGYNSTRAGYLDDIPGINSRVDTTVSSRRAPYTTRTRVSAAYSVGGSSDTVLSVGGPGVVHALRITNNGALQVFVDVVIDGTTVISSLTIPVGGNIITSDGDQMPLGNTQMDGRSESLQWEFRSSLVVTFHSPSSSSGTLFAMYAN